MNFESLYRVVGTAYTPSMWSVPIALYMVTERSWSAMLIVPISADMMRAERLGADTVTGFAFWASMVTCRSALITTFGTPTMVPSVKDASK